MARRSRKTLQAEGQLSLFAMTDDFLFAVTENTENAVDKAAESRSYVNQIAGEPPADAWLIPISNARICADDVE